MTEPCLRAAAVTPRTGRRPASRPPRSLARARRNRYWLSRQSGAFGAWSVFRDRGRFGLPGAGRANADFRHGLEDRSLAYALQVWGEVTAQTESAVPHQPAYAGLGPRPLPRYRTRSVSLREHLLAAGRARAVTVTWRKGSKAAMSARSVFLRVRLAGRRPKPAPDGVIGLRWLIAQWPEGENQPVRY